MITYIIPNCELCSTNIRSIVEVAKSLCGMHKAFANSL